VSKILVTGASGDIGRRTLQHLLKRTSASELVGLARDPAKAADLSAHGVDIRKGDYANYNSLVQAFAGVEKVLLISTHAFADRETEHANVIQAASEAGVRHVLYTPVILPEGSKFELMQVTQPDIFTVKTLKESGLTYTIVAHPPFIESFEFYIGGKAFETGVRVPAGNGKAAPAARDNLAEAQAVILTSAGHENKSYALTGDPAISFADFAQILSEIHGKTVPYITVSDEQYIANLVVVGLPEVAAQFALGWVHGINSGEWSKQNGDLERLLGRKPTTTAEVFRAGYPTPQT